MAKVVFICNAEQHNKTWSYEKIGTSVKIEWSRVGLDGQSQTKTFDSDYEADAFIAKKVDEKVRKGYKKVSQEQLKEEVKTAQNLGWQYKISKIQWVNRLGNTLSLIKEYDPSKYVYVEILNSWSKETTHLLLNKTDSFQLEGISGNGEGAFSRATPMGNHFVDAIREHLRDLFKKVKAVISTAKFAAIGARKLSLDDTKDEESPEETPVMAEFYKSVGEGASNQVISKFIGLGNRVLDL